MAMKNFSILVYCYDFENQYRMWYTGYLVRLVFFVLVFFYSFLKTTYRSVTESYLQYVIHTCVFSHCLILHSVDRHTLISIFNKKLQVLYLRDIFIEYIFLQILQTIFANTSVHYCRTVKECNLCSARVVFDFFLIRQNVHGAV